MEGNRKSTNHGRGRPHQKPGIHHPGECATYHPDNGHDRRFEQDHPTYLPAKPADRPQHTQLPLPLGDRDYQRIDNPKDGNDHGNRRLHIIDEKETIDQFEHPFPILGIGIDKCTKLPTDHLLNLVTYCSDGSRIGFQRLFEIDIDEIDRRVVPVFTIDAPIKEDGPLLRGIVIDDPDDRALKGARR